MMRRAAGWLQRSLGMGNTAVWHFLAADDRAVVDRHPSSLLMSASRFGDAGPEFHRDGADPRASMRGSRRRCGLPLWGMRAAVGERASDSGRRPRSRRPRRRDDR